MLLQVAVVLVRRVLGRTDQRKQCPGQMETLERLRAVREQVQDNEDEAFIVEVLMKHEANTMRIWFTNCEFKQHNFSGN